MLDDLLNMLENVSPDMKKNLICAIQESNDLSQIIKEIKKALDLIEAEAVEEILKKSDMIIADSRRSDKN